MLSERLLIPLEIKLDKRVATKSSKIMLSTNKYLAYSLSLFNPTLIN